MRSNEDRPALSKRGTLKTERLVHQMDGRRKLVGVFYGNSNNCTHYVSGPCDSWYVEGLVQCGPDSRAHTENGNLGSVIRFFPDKTHMNAFVDYLNSMFRRYVTCDANLFLEATFDDYGSYMPE